MRTSQKIGAVVGSLVICVPMQVWADFSYQPPGQLVSGSGTGRVDQNVYVEGMRFPIENAPAYANSQVWGHGGMNGPGGGQCHANNFKYPWWDNFCESRSWEMPMCPGGTGHQGQDIRAASCEDKKHWAVAAVDGKITNVGSYSVYLRAADGTQHRYLHMDPPSVQVKVGDTVSKGKRLGRVSNAFGGTPTTVHLHYDLQQNISGLGQVYVPTYLSLVRSYQRLIGQPQEPCGYIEAEGGVIDNGDACFFLLGNIGTWRTESAGYGGDLNWTYAYDGNLADGYARWGLHFEEPGLYELEVYVDGEYADTKKARYVIRAAGQEKEVRVDQSTGGGWRGLGEFEFVGDDDEWVEIYDNTGEPLSERLRFVADGLRLTRLNGGDVGDDEEPDDGDVGGEEPGADPVDEPGEPDEPGEGDGTDTGIEDSPDVGVPGQGEAQFQDQSAAMTSSCAVSASPSSTGTALLSLVGLLALRTLRRRRS